MNSLIKTAGILYVFAIFSQSCNYIPPKISKIEVLGKDTANINLWVRIDKVECECRVFIEYGKPIPFQPPKGTYIHPCYDSLNKLQLNPYTIYNLLPDSLKLSPLTFE